MDYERTSWAKRRSEQRKRDAALRYELEMESRKMNGVPAVVYDEQKNLFPFRDGRFASASTPTGRCVMEVGPDEGALRREAYSFSPSSVRPPVSLSQ